MPKPNRIAMLSVHTSPLATLGGKKTGGMNVYVRDFTTELSRQGFVVDVFTRAQAKEEIGQVQPLGDMGRVIAIPAGPATYLSTSEIPQYIAEFAQNLLAFTKQEGSQYDLIHSHYWISGMVAEILKQQWQIPIVQMFHTLGHMKNRIAQSASERAPQTRIDGETHVIRIADKLIAPTPAEETQLKWLYQANAEKVVIIPPGVDLNRFHPISQSEAKAKVDIPAHHQNILFVGRIEPLKGVDTLLQAMALIQTRHPQLAQNTCVAIIGGDTENPEGEMIRLQSLREELGVKEVVTFLGAKGQDLLPYYYAATEMLIMPSHYESFGMVALEALAMGTPVIASEVGGLAYVVQDGINGFHVPSRDPEALAERIYTLLTDEASRTKLAKQARDYAKKYAWEKIVERMTAVYQTL